MTKQEKIKKIKQLIEEIETEENEETEKTVAIPNDAIVIDKTDGGYCSMKYAIRPMWLSPYQLACTVGARIPNAKWAAVDSEGDMYWYESEPKPISGKWRSAICLSDSEGNLYRVPCEVDNWKNAKWRIR